jgi:L,D-transpeptidase ErfK/SrfK
MSTMHLFKASLFFALYLAPLALGAQTPAATLSGTARTYTVVPGDALYGIARRNGMAWPALARANRIENPNLIRVGQALTLPSQCILPGQKTDGIVVNIPEQRLYLFRAGSVKAVFPAAVGLPTWQTPLGDFTVTTKVENPAWYMPPDLARRENVKREVIEAGPDNPLGDFWIGTSLSHTGIHGTNVPMTIGRPLSHGCMRLYPEHIDSLFQMVAIGDSGAILYEPVKLALDGDDVLLEVHPDIYAKLADPAKTAEQRIRAAGVWDKIDAARLQQVASETRGIPVSIRKP